MSSRRQSRRVTKTDVDYKEDNNSGISEDEVLPAPAKKRKTTGSGQKEASKRRKGKLSKLPDMPLDVLYEVMLEKPRGIERHWTYLAVDLFAPSPARSPQDLMDHQGIPSRSHNYLVQNGLEGLVRLRRRASRLP